MKYLRSRADLIVAVLLSIMFAVEMALIDDVTGPRVLNVLAGIVVSAPLAFLKRSAFITVVVVMSLAVVQSLFLTPYFNASASFLGLMWMTYRAGELSGVRPEWKTLAAILAGNVVVGALYDDSGDMFVAAIAPVALWLAGRGVAQHNRLNRELARRAETADRERDARAQLAAAEERARIAGELQGIVIAEVRKIEDAAAVARHAAEDPRAARHAFGELAVIARRGLDQMRALLGVLRDAREADDARRGDSAVDGPELPPRGVRAYERTIGRLPGWYQDVAVALIWGVVLVVISQTNQQIDPGMASATVAIALAVTVLWRRRSPAGVAAAMLVIQALAGVVFEPETRGVGGLIALFIPLYTAGRQNGPLEKRLGFWLPALVAGALVLMSPLAVWSDLLFPPLFLLLAYVFGRGMGSRAQLGEVLEEEARQLEAARDNLAAAAVVDERLRIARDLHDVGAHSLSMIVLQAEAGKRMAERDPVAATRIAGTITSAARTALAEVEGLVRGATRVTGVAAIESLVADARARGLEVSVEVATGPLPPVLDEVAYRVVQEALTNTVKHAGPTLVSIELTTADGELIILVRDAGPEPAARVPRLAESGGGHGLAGMRERVELAGGWLSAGPEGNGFVVEARLPLSAAVAA